MNKRLLSLRIIFLFLVVVTGCAGLIPGDTDLTSTQWRLSAWSDSSSDPSQFTITAHFNAYAIYGTSAVNYYSGSYIATAGGFFSVTDLQMTLMAGSGEAMQAESIYFQLLGQADKFTLDQETLTLLDATNHELLIFSRKEPD